MQLSSWSRSVELRSSTQACRDDADLLKEVESLLKVEGQTIGFLRKPVLDATEQIAAGAIAGKRIGAYEVMRQLGEGGMGKVYLAARADDLYQKEVAIKTVQGGLGQNRAMLLRFSSERQILANLDHPGIARLLDGGITEDGLPYLVMEYVNGIPVDAYCRINKLGTEQRLQLFCAVCAAVEYAHKNLVVHRDIKPANISSRRKAFRSCWISALQSYSTPRPRSPRRRGPPNGS